MIFDTWLRELTLLAPDITSDTSYGTFSNDTAPVEELFFQADWGVQSMSGRRAARCQVPSRKAAKLGWLGMSKVLPLLLHSAESIAEPTGKLTAKLRP